MSEKHKTVAKTPETKSTNVLSRKPETAFPKSLNSPIDQILSLQRTIGNKAVQRLLKFGVLQAKLKIGQPNDIYEQEADRVADAVMRIPEHRLQSLPAAEAEEEEEKVLQPKPFADQIMSLVQRQVGPEEEEEEPIQTKLIDSVQVQRQEEKEPEDEEKPIQSERTGEKTPQVSYTLEAQINSMRGSGQPLPKSARDFFEPLFGADFSQVRLHRESYATEAARAVNARAFTADRNIVFGAGQYAEGSVSGKKLLAHELTHVIQQNSDSITNSHSNRLMRRVRGMVTRTLEGYPPSDEQWNIIRNALRRARQMVSLTVSRINGIHNLLLPGSDPRAYSLSQREAAEMFRRHFRSSSAIDALEATEYYGYILAALNSLGRNSFRVVSDQLASQKSNTDDYAYVYGREPNVYLSESYFSELSRVERRQRVTVGPRLLSADQKARILVHETAHFRLGVRHRGGVFGFDVVNCENGLPVRTSSQALNNAYIYDHFAFCIAQSST